LANFVGGEKLNREKKKWEVNKQSENFSERTSSPRRCCFLMKETPLRKGWKVRAAPGMYVGKA
jgi:hypothetical protein